MTKGFAGPDFQSASAYDLNPDLMFNPDFARWVQLNTTPHRDPRHIIVSVSLKEHGKPPGDATAEQMLVLAQLAKQHSYDELRVSHEQNIILPHVPKADLYQVWSALNSAELGTANIGLASDIIACPGLDFCALATARSIPIAQQIANHVRTRRQEQDIGPLKIKISGCINACGHHHVGHIGILGLEKAGKESYQITLGGDGSQLAALGERTGPGFSAEQLLFAIDTILTVYLQGRHTSEESFIQFYRRVGLPPV